MKMLEIYANYMKKGADVSMDYACIHAPKKKQALLSSLCRGVALRKKIE